MATILNIAKYVVNGDPYPPLLARHTVRSSAVFQILTTATTDAIVERVENYVRGKCGEAALSEITEENAYEYLAATKLIDMTIASEEMVNSTYKIRELCLLNSKVIPGVRNKINIMNAFSNPPADLEDVDLLLANEIDNVHPAVTSAPFGEPRNKILSKIYDYSQTKALVVPELVSIVEEVVAERFAAMEKVSTHIPEKTMIVFKGCSGSGKSYALRHFLSEEIGAFSPNTAVQSTDNTKKDIRERTGKVFTDQQVHLFGFAVFKMMSQEIKNHSPDISTLQEGWFNSSPGIENLFKDLSKQGLKLQMKDFDGDFEALALRVLARQGDIDTPRPPLEQVVRGFKTSRESRPQLLCSIRNEDTYAFRFVDKYARISDEKDPLSVPSLPEAVDLEILQGKDLVISEAHVDLFGEHLRNVVGLTISEAFTKEV